MHNMKKLEKLNELKKKVKGSFFTIENASKYLGLGRRATYSLVKELIEKRELVKIARDIYKFSKLRTKPGLNTKLENLRKLLLKKTSLEFSFTGLSVLEKYLHHIPYSIVYLLYIEPGSGEEVNDLISSKVTVLINPSYEEITLFLEKTKVKTLLVARELNYFYGSKEGIASYEKAFIDLYFEVTRGNLPFIHTDINEILRSLIMNDELNYSVLLRCAGIRKIKSEVNALLKEFSKEFEIPGVITR